MTFVGYIVKDVGYVWIFDCVDCVCVHVLTCVCIQLLQNLNYYITEFMYAL